MEHEAIYQLYSTAKSVEVDENNNYIARDIDGNEVSIDMTAVNTKASELQAEADAKPSEDELKASAKAKLIAGEALTEEEADTIVL
tara:strand:- start:340 stop:597 length:258 start_codon:yes stop_codon:yes gene_type:complete